MKNEYEALAKLNGKNFAVLDDGRGVYLTPTGEIRDTEGMLLMPAFEGRAKLYRMNEQGGHVRMVTEMIPGYVDCRDGSLKTGGNWQRTDYIPVNSNDLVTFSGRIGDYSGVAGYDENKNFVVSLLDQIDEGKTGETYLNEPLDIRENVAYIVGCTNSPANAITVMVYDNMKPLADAILTLVDSRPV